MWFVPEALGRPTVHCLSGNALCPCLWSLRTRHRPGLRRSRKLLRMPWRDEPHFATCGSSPRRWADPQSIVRQGMPSVRVCRFSRLATGPGCAVRGAAGVLSFARAHAIGRCASVWRCSPLQQRPPVARRARRLGGGPRTGRDHPTARHARRAHFPRPRMSARAAVPALWPALCGVAATPSAAVRSSAPARPFWLWKARRRTGVPCP